MSGGALAHREGREDGGGRGGVSKLFVLPSLSPSLSPRLAVTPGGSYYPQGHSWSLVP